MSDIKDTVRWAEQGDAHAQETLGRYYQKGDLGFEKNPELAAEWYRKSADSGLSQAALALAHMYREGEGVEQDNVMGALLYERATDETDRMHGEPWRSEAQFHLGELYEEGLGVRKDYPVSYMWFNLAEAADRFHGGAAGRERVAGLMTREQVAEAQRLSREWKPRDTKTPDEDDLDTDDRSASALEADKLQERIVHSGRVGQFWGLLAVLAVGVGVSEWLNVAMIYIITGIAAWIVFSLHLSFTQVLHEMYELNDQIAGRKDEFQRLIQDRPSPDPS